MVPRNRKRKDALWNNEKRSEPLLSKLLQNPQNSLNFPKNPCIG